MATDADARLGARWRVAAGGRRRGFARRSRRSSSTLAEGGTPGSQDRDQVAGYAGFSPADHPWSVVVGHDGVFKITLLTLFDLPLERFWMWTMDLCGITVIEFRAGRAVLRAHNLTGHLSAMLDEAAVEATEERSRSGAL